MKKDIEKLKSLKDQNKNLFLINQSLETSLKNKNLLLKTLIHDTANPLSIVIGGLEAYKKNLNIGKFYNRVEKASNQMQSLINQVKNLDKCEAREIKTDISILNLRECLEKTLPLFTEKLINKNIEIVLDYDEVRNINFYCDEKIFINSIIPNVLSNAIKFAHPGSQICIKALIKDDGECLIKVIDQGIGIPRNRLNKIFDFKSQTTRPGTCGEKGTGYGLPIIKEFVKKCGGNIHINSNQETVSAKGRTEVCLTFNGPQRTQKSIITAA